MLMLINKNMTNITIYTVKELHTFIKSLKAPL